MIEEILEHLSEIETLLSECFDEDLIVVDELVYQLKEEIESLRE